ncbi:006d6eed-1103-44ba-ad19-c6e766c0151a [Thermothielavioides terrestris]|uniref:006d6eed-1103-44ba-ad19-c6e766c0151a n=1 Tax=Thermothielavioides terrestris TaxID=2587410 RepID=A0A3S4BHB7_9PEZI|nr:006d6eed-1103-44ba-ad19-c6e766c0151a [Thermothielavioides terrestris]
MDEETQSNTKGQAAPASPATSRQQTSSDVPTGGEVIAAGAAAASPTIANAITIANAAVDRVAMTESQQPANPGTARVESPSPHFQTTATASTAETARQASQSAAPAPNSVAGQRQVNEEVVHGRGPMAAAQLDPAEKASPAGTGIGAGTAGTGAATTGSPQQLEPPGPSLQSPPVQQSFQPQQPPVSAPSPSAHPHTAPHPQSQPAPPPPQQPLQVPLQPHHPQHYPPPGQPPAAHTLHTRSLQQHQAPLAQTGRVQSPPAHPQHPHPPQQQFYHQHYSQPQPQPHQQPPPPQPQPLEPVPASALPALHQPQPQAHLQFHSHPQPQPQPQQSLPPLPHTSHQRAPGPKPVIMDPPGLRKATQSQSSQQQTAMGFPSPTRDYAAANPKFVDDCTRMNYALLQSLPEAVRRIVRDHWEKCLLGSEFHQAFILNASIHHAPASVMRRALRDFGGKMVAESKHELIAHFTTEALDEVADHIISKASDSFLDKCLEKRLLTIEAKPLINALAKAERLGYEPGDIVQDDQHERVIPQEAYPGAATGANGFHAHPSQPSSANAQGNRQQLQCLQCFRTFLHASAYDYHTKYNGCSRVEELQAHLDNKVCGNFSQPTKVSRGPGRPPKNPPAPQPNQAVILPSPSSQSRAANGYSGTQLQSTPARSSLAGRPAGATPGSTSSPIAADPYAHLTEEQMAAMNEELREAEAKYAPRFADAELIPDENARRQKIEGLRNSFGTKQSMIRKKYGVRLRERRTKAEIMAERERMGLKRAEKEKAKAMAAAAAAAAAAARQNSSPRANVEAASRAAGGGGSSSGWIAANTPRASALSEEEHDLKRRRLDESGGYQTPYKSQAPDSPTRKTLPVSEIGGGLSGAAATPATHDPTLPPPPSQPTKVYEQSGARVEIHEPAQAQASKPGASSRPDDASASATPAGSDETGASRRPASRQDPAAAEKKPVIVLDNDSSSSDDDDEDIPSTLPAHVRKSLASGSTSLVPNH